MTTGAASDTVGTVAGGVGITRVGVAGGGRVGCGLAEVGARAHVDVVVWESTRARMTAALDRILGSIGGGVSRGEITERERDEAISRLRGTTDLAELADRQLVVEAAAEDESVKAALLRDLDEVVVDPGAVLATSTSSLSVTRLGAGIRRPERIVGLHFFDPVSVVPLVELVTTAQTSDAVADRARAFAESVLGKQVLVSEDRSGFVVNALLVPYVLSAVRMVEAGVASVEDVDAAMVHSCAHPQGPLSLADHFGLDTVKAVANAMHSECGEPLYRPPALLDALVDSGRTGRRAGHGFYRYDSQGRVSRGGPLPVPGRAEK